MAELIITKGNTLQRMAGFTILLKNVQVHRLPLLYQMEKAWKYTG